MISSFVQPLMLIGLPLMALPILIHLINRQRHRTLEWGAMMFLLDAKRMTRGIAKLRYWLIMAMRMLAVATLIFAVARPLASGRMGVTLGGAADTTIIVLDRSASMQQQDEATGETKQSAALHKLVELMRTVGKSPHVVLIENTENRPLTVESPEALLEMPPARGSDTAADLPAMLQTALDYVVANRAGRTDIWICSDLQANDWKWEDGRWVGLREGFAPHEAVRFYVLSYTGAAPDNLAVRVQSARVGLEGGAPQLVMDVVVRRPGGAGRASRVPVEFVINGARSVVNIEMDDIEYRLQGHTIALVGDTRSGWGYVELPADANLHDNRYYFVFGDAPQRHTIIVSDDPRVARLFRMAVEAPVDPELSFTSETLSPQQLRGVDWERASLVVWQAPLPDGGEAGALGDFVASGRPVIFFPPAQPTNTAFAGWRWDQWQAAQQDAPHQVQTWRGDSGLLAHSEGGMALPLGKLAVYRHCLLQGDGQPLASLDNGDVLLQRGSLGQGAFYFFATLPGAADSNMLRDGVTFYVMLQRALAVGAATRSKVAQRDASGDSAAALRDWRLLSQLPDGALSTDCGLLGAVFQLQDRLAAVNRPAAEDEARYLASDQVDELFQGLRYRQVEEQIGSAEALASEIWRVFVFLMAAALIAEALLCLPERKISVESTARGGLAGAGQTG